MNRADWSLDDMALRPLSVAVIMIHSQVIPELWCMMTRHLSSVWCVYFYTVLLANIIFLLYVYMGVCSKSQ